MQRAPGQGQPPQLPEQQQRLPPDAALEAASSEQRSRQQQQLQQQQAEAGGGTVAALVDRFEGLSAAGSSGCSTPLGQSGERWGPCAVARWVKSSRCMKQQLTRSDEILCAAGDRGPAAQGADHPAAPGAPAAAACCSHPAACSGECCCCQASRSTPSTGLEDRGPPGSPLSTLPESGSPLWTRSPTLVQRSMSLAGGSSHQHSAGGSPSICFAPGSAGSSGGAGSGAGSAAPAPGLIRRRHTSFVLCTGSPTGPSRSPPSAQQQVAEVLRHHHTSLAKLKEQMGGDLAGGWLGGWVGGGRTMRDA